MSFDPTWFAQQRELSKHLTTHIVSHTPPIDRHLDQILAQTNLLRKRTASRLEDNVDARAAFLLANEGFDAQAVKVPLNSSRYQKY